MKIEINKKNSNDYGLYIINVLLIIILIFFLSNPLVTLLNKKIYDLIQRDIKSNQDILIVEIDEETINDIGLFPWDSETVDTFIKNVEAKGAKLIAINLEEGREIDEIDSMIVSLNERNIPIILNKSSDASKPSMSGIETGYNGYKIDLDDKIRTVETRDSHNRYFESFSYKIYKEYSKLTSKNLDYSVPDRIQFYYTQEDFNSVKFENIIKDRIPRSQIDGKLLMIGTDKNISKNGNDQLSAIEVQANIVNSLLYYNFNVEIGEFIFFIIISSVCIIATHVLNHFKVKRIKGLIDILICLNIFGVILFMFGKNWPFIQANVVPIFSFSYCCIYYRWVDYNKNKSHYGSFITFLLDRNYKKRERHVVTENGVFEKRVMTVLFSDIRDFTTISETLLPDQLTILLNKYLGEMSDIIADYDGKVDKYLGDGLLAYWNAPNYDPHHQKKAIDCSITMMKNLKSFNDRHLSTGNLQLKAGIGINTGEIRIGSIGGKEKSEYTVLGDNVNLCSRVEGLTKKYGVNILLTECVVSEELNNSSKMIFRTIDEVIVKGKSTAIRIVQPMLYCVNNLKLKTYYDKAFELYQKGKFESSLEIFEALYFDKPSQLLAQRIKDLNLNRINEWNGTWAWVSK